MKTDSLLLDFTPKELAIDALLKVPALTGKISKSCKIPQKEVLELLNEVMCFLELIGKLNQKLTPSLIVDLAWHELILCTRYYHQLCETQFGRYIHHHPGGEEKENQQQFLNTIKLYTEHFGHPPSKYWGKVVDDIPTSSDCGTCSSI
jgi:hypothetical protein